MRARRPRSKPLLIHRHREDQAELAQRPAALAGPAVEDLLRRGPLAAVFRGSGHPGPMLEPGADRARQHECVLADHAQKTRPGIAAHLAELLAERVPQPDDVGARPGGEPRAKALVLLG